MSSIFFATNRNIKFETSKTANNFGDRFNVHGPQCFRVGKVDVSLKGGDPFTENDDNWQVKNCALYPEELNDVTPDSTAKLGSERLFEELRQELKNKNRDVLIFLHGFANDFANSAARAAALQRLYSRGKKKLLVVFFSWPSDGTVLPPWKYCSDRDDSEASGLAMGRALTRLTTFLEKLRQDDQQKILASRRQGEIPDRQDLKQCQRKIHLVAHSMGNWALRHALNKFTQNHNGRVPRIIDHAFLMAADEDSDALSHKSKLENLLHLANNVHVYHAKDDIALEISDKTKGNPARLGTDGPENLNKVHERVSVIDCSEVSDTQVNHGRHQYYRLRKEVIQDVVATINDQPQDNRKNRVAIKPGQWWRLISQQ